jgi:hypothetical protein
MNADDPHQIEDVMARELKKLKEEELHPSHALQNIADALPALERFPIRLYRIRRRRSSWRTRSA